MPEREPFDPLAALRAMGDVQRAGLEAAASVVERILELGRHGARMPYSFHLPAQPVDGTDANGADALKGAHVENGVDTPTGADAATGADVDADRAREVRRLRADAELLLELWGEWMRVLLDAAMDGAEAGVAERDAAGAHGGDQPLRLGPVKAGHPASGGAWVHILDGPPGPLQHSCVEHRRLRSPLLAHNNQRVNFACFRMDFPEPIKGGLLHRVGGQNRQIAIGQLS